MFSGARSSACYCKFSCLVRVRTRKSRTGPRHHAIEALEIASRGRVLARCECKGLSELKEAYDALKQCKVAGRIILEMSN
ncbi:uncharacterized protein BJ212DRAFT_1382637 [Suillus subaureus]|uniref:Alcohol dehydrogenase-like C-terminal domain-containing protein n=1 Tax=Suillus subaureus TaxID=48587 RepID=A0A9P7E1V8_9AGAM|nr:uncharacterized protein BJ212DRAFT_1382637 [Suillus subaureus]KAG1808692.1 hypothetical protein BJ212DRAFT_1382637 [Suillus subaureus]